MLVDEVAIVVEVVLIAARAASILEEEFEMFRELLWFVAIPVLRVLRRASTLEDELERFRLVEL